MQAGGQRFDPANLHHLKLNRSIQVIECFDLVSKETGKDCTLKTEQCIMKVISKATERSVPEMVQKLVILIVEHRIDG